MDGNGGDIFLNTQTKNIKVRPSVMNVQPHHQAQNTKFSPYKLNNFNYEDETVKKKKTIDVIELSKLNNIYDNFKEIKQKQENKNVNTLHLLNLKLK